MKQIVTFLLGFLILSGAYSSLHASDGGGGGGAPAEEVTQKTNLKNLLFELQTSKITPETNLTTLLARLSGLSHDEIKFFLDALQKRKKFSELSESLRKHIMFVSYYVQNEEDAMKDPEEFISQQYVQNEEDAMKDPEEFISQQEVFLKIKEETSRTTYFDASALRFYKAIINPQKAGKVALYKYSEKEPFFIIGCIRRSESAYQYTASYWKSGKSHNSLFFNDERIQPTGSSSFDEIQEMRDLMGTKIKDPRAFIKNFFDSNIQDDLFNKFNYKQILLWAFEDLAFQNGGFFSSRDILILSNIADIKNADIKSALIKAAQKYIVWSKKTHHLCSEERRDAVKLFLLIDNRILTTKRKSYISNDALLRILSFL